MPALPTHSLSPYSPPNARHDRATKHFGEKAHDDSAAQPPPLHPVIDGSGQPARRLTRDHRPRRGRDVEAEMLLLAAQRSQIRQRPRLLRQPRQADQRQRPGRADRRHVLSRQPARPGDRRHQLGQARRHRPDGVGLVDLGQSRARWSAPSTSAISSPAISSRPRRSTAARPSRSRTRCSRAPTSASSPGPTISARAACCRRSR